MFRPLGAIGLPFWIKKASQALRIKLGTCSILSCTATVKNSNKKRTSLVHLKAECDFTSRNTHFEHEEGGSGIQALTNSLRTLQAVCVTVAAIIQYFLMAAFCWMLVEGIYLYLYVVKVYNITSKMAIYHIMSWCKSSRIVCC